MMRLTEPALRHTLRAQHASPLSPPRILTDGMDKTLEERAFARLMAGVAAFQTSRPYEIVRRQGDYARRLDALAMLRGRE